jgi:hypothetical protein
MDNFFLYLLYNVGDEKLTTIYKHHFENTLNSTSIRCGFDIFLLSCLLFIITNLWCIVLTNVYVNL